jgi:hypothetical protein
MCPLRSGCVGATKASIFTPSRRSNSSNRAYNGSYIGPPTSSTLKGSAMGHPQSRLLHHGTDHGLRRRCSGPLATQRPQPDCRGGFQTRLSGSRTALNCESPQHNGSSRIPPHALSQRKR